MIAILNLIIDGVFALKDKKQIDGTIGLILFPVGVVYFLVMSAA